MYIVGLDKSTGFPLKDTISKVQKANYIGVNPKQAKGFIHQK